ncbi:hypothetical protein CH299_29105 [Rhodococcus sp. 14-2686-1-2]|nr:MULTISPECIES: hypothetical protein [unclassified Rhodococcus (in: high G+C Gram-positive bacteria)]OZE92968.1 hypothetical protein CH301_28590 [Rhodococcus sp. 15-1189-1-1a]OZF08222.1 hypothetical protein CH299_29105 [Rhodococcus sp. 14-2686-1-2]
MAADSPTGISEAAALLLPPEQVLLWAENAYSIRSCELVLERMLDPRPKSALAETDAIYPWEKVSVWTRNYLLAAAENLSLWADLVAPYEFQDGAVNRVRMRPYLLLARSGMEAAAHAIWLLDVRSRLFTECSERHIRMMHHDFSMHKKALVARGDDTTAIEERITKLVERAAKLPFDAKPKVKPPGYELLVRNAAKVVGEDPDEWAYLWNAASGAGHGQNWFGIEGFDLLPSAEYEPGHYRTTSIPDPIYITDTIGAATSALMWGTSRWLQYSGHDPAVLRSAAQAVFEKMPKKSSPEAE